MSKKVNIKTATKGDKDRAIYEIGKKMDYPIEMLNYSYPDDKKIFDVKSNYYVATHVSDLWEEENSLSIEVTLDNLQKATLILRQVPKVGIRFLFSAMEPKSNKFNEHLNNNIDYQMPNYKIIDSDIHIKVNSDTLVITKVPFNITVYDKNDKVKFELNRRKGFPWWGGYINPPIGFKSEKNSNKMKPFLSWNIKATENYYGLGETFKKLEKSSVRKTINNVGTSANSNNDLSYAAIPYIVSTNNWGILVNTSAKTYFDVSSSTADAGSLATSEEDLDFFLILGDSIKKIVENYTILTGKTKSVPERAYGVFLGRLYYHDRDEAEKELIAAKKNNFPVDVIHIDPKWLKQRYNKSCNFKRHTERWGEFSEMFKSFYDKYDAGTSIWINPYIQRDNEEFFKLAIENDYLVKSNITGDGYFHPWTGPEKWQLSNYVVDFTNPKATEWWKEYVREIASDGAFTVVADYGEGITDDAIFYNGKTGKQMRHYYTYLYIKAQFEAFEEIKGKGNVMNLARPGYIGSQKYTGKWGGDSTSTWPELKMQLQAGLSVAFNGVNFWGGDIGGFLGIPTESLLIRWLQVGCLMPFGRFHGTGPREPWNYSEKATTIAKKMVNLKRSWIPYYKLYEYEAIKTGVTTIRPLVMEFQDDIMVRNIETQYMLGDSIMVAPVLEENSTENQVYFPKGKWVDYFKPEIKFEGERKYNIKTSLSSIPVYARVGYIHVSFEKGNYEMSKIGDQKLIVKAFIGQKNKSVKTLILDNKKIVIKYDITETTADVKVTGWKNYEILKIK